MAKLSLTEIKKIIPHRPTFLLIDEVIENIPGKKIIAKKFLKKNESWFEGHFPSNPIQPGVLTIEMLAQAGAVCILSLPENKGKLALFAGIEKARFKKQIKPETEIVLKVEIDSVRASIGCGIATALVNNEVAVSAKLMFAIANNNELTE